MNVFAINLLLMLAWAALAGEFSATNLAVGFALGLVALWAARPILGGSVYFARGPRLVRLFFVFLYELAVSSIRVALDVLSLRPSYRPGIVAVPLRVRSETEVLVLSSLISLTPGTLSLDLSEDGRTLYVHGMFVDDPEALKREIAERLEQPVLEALG